MEYNDNVNYTVQALQRRIYIIEGIGERDKKCLCIPGEEEKMAGFRQWGLHSGEGLWPLAGLSVMGYSKYNMSVGLMKGKYRAQALFLSHLTNTRHLIHI